MSTKAQQASGVEVFQSRRAANESWMRSES